MLVRTKTAILFGVRAVPVEVEVDVSPGICSFSLVGLAGSGVRESRERIRTAFRNSGFAFPDMRITVNLAPADVKKEGSSFDLPVAAGILTATGQAEAEKLGTYLVAGELSLDGTIKPVAGAVSLAYLAKRMGLAGIIVPPPNFYQASLISGIDVVPIPTLRDFVRFLNGEDEFPPHPVPPRPGEKRENRKRDLSDVVGQETAKRALEIAAAGGHNLLYVGPPGTGKSMLAERIVTILPDPDEEEVIEINEVHSLNGSAAGGRILRERPFRSPHHSISYAGMVGGGNPPVPGEVTLAHRGVLFLDEFPEFRRDVLEALRQPMETGVVVITRSSHSFTFPARFSLIATANPCGCGYYGYPERECVCRPRDLVSYRKKLTGPVIDRIDMQVEMLPPPRRDIIERTSPGESSQAVKKRVIRAREIQKERYGKLPWKLNSFIPGRETLETASPTEEARRLLERASETLGLSARAIHRILKISRTIADLEEEKRVLPRHVSEALHYRFLDREKRR
ncbi:MAG: ATP-binding protein [Deltaproteobacteria bacterium]|nr:MAG: ATP-binding protein [Deltaproteobacteria bacterium]